MHRKLLIGVGAALLAAGCGGSDKGNEAVAGEPAAQGRTSVGEALAASGDHSAFVEALEAAGLAETLRGGVPYTVFAPTNAAFQAVEGGRPEGDALRALLSHHIVPGTVTAEDIGRAVDQGQGGRAELATHAGDNLGFARDGDAIVLTDGAGNRARLVGAEQIHANGVVHSVDAVLRPGGE